MHIAIFSRYFYFWMCNFREQCYLIFYVMEIIAQTWKHMMLSLFLLATLFSLAENSANIMSQRLGSLLSTRSRARSVKCDHQIFIKIFRKTFQAF